MKLGLFFILFCMTQSLLAQSFTYQDEKGKTLSKAQLEALDKKHQGFLSLEIVDEGPPIRVQVRPPSPLELKTLQKLRLEETATLQKKWLGKALPAFSLTSSANTLFTNKKLVGHTTLLFFWSKSDYRSIAQFPALERLVKQNKGKPVQFWALTFEDAVLVKEFLKKHPLSFTHLPGNFSFVMEELGIMQTPVFMVLDKKGLVRFVSTETQPTIDLLLTPELNR